MNDLLTACVKGGRMQVPGIDFGVYHMPIVVRGPAAIVVKIPGHKVWRSQIQPWGYSPAHFIVFSVIGKFKRPDKDGEEWGTVRKLVSIPLRGTE